MRTIGLDYICLACKETKVEYQDGNAVKGQHVFSGNICYTCGYERKEEKTEETKKPEITADNQKNGENKPNESETTHVCKFMVVDFITKV